MLDLQSLYKSLVSGYDLHSLGAYGKVFLKAYYFFGLYTRCILII